MSQAPADPAPQRASRSRRIISFIIALALLAAAGAAVFTHADEFERSIRSAASSSPWLIAAALLLPLANWIIMSISFWILMRRLGRVRLGEMACLIGAAWLLNYLPLRPGLLGRVAYHKTVHAIPVMHSIRASIWSIFAAAGAIACLLAATLAAATLDSSTQSHLAAIAGVPVLLGAALTLAIRIAGRSWWIPLTVVLRYIDLLIWALRYIVVFAMIGHPISWPSAAAIAAAVQVAMLVPLVGNGLGLREWTVGLTSSLLPPALISSRGPLTTTIGLAADLANRTAEVICAIPVGLTCALLLARRKS